VPLLWLAALTLYLFSLSISFARVRPPWCGRWLAGALVQLLAAAAMLHPLWMSFKGLLPDVLPRGLTEEQIGVQSLAVAVALIALLLIPHRWTIAAQLGSTALVAVLLIAQPKMPFSLLMIAHLLAVYMACWGCHGELACRRPDGSYLA